MLIMALGLCIVCRGSRKVEIHTLLYTYIYTHTHIWYLFMLCLLHRKCWGANIPIGLCNVIIKFKFKTENIKERKPIISVGGHGAVLYGLLLLMPEKRHRLSKRVWPDCIVNVSEVKVMETERWKQSPRGGGERDGIQCREGPWTEFWSRKRAAGKIQIRSVS